MKQEEIPKDMRVVEDKLCREAEEPYFIAIPGNIALEVSKTEHDRIGKHESKSQTTKQEI